jgi:alpha-1,2-mannosyltransferase
MSLRWTVRVLAAAAVVLFAALWLRDTGKARMIDFNSFYTAAQAAREGADLYDPAALNELAAGQGLRMYVFPYLYPPFLAYATIPWGELPVERARLVWMAANLAALFGIVALTALAVGRRLRESPGRRLGPGDLGLAFAAVFVFVLPFNDNLDMGQSNLLVLLFLCLALFLVSCDRPWAGGAALGVAVLLKVSPVVLVLYFLARRQVRVVLGSLLSAAVLSAVTLALGAAEAWARFFAVLPEMSHATARKGMPPPGFFPNFSVAGLMSRVFPEDLPAARIWTLALLAALAAALALGLWRAAGERAKDLYLLPFLVLMVVSSPFTYLHHGVYVLPGAVLALTWVWEAFRPAARLAWAAVLLALLRLASTNFPERYRDWDLSPLAGRLATSLNLYALLLLLAAGVILAARARHRRPELT